MATIYYPQNTLLYSRQVSGSSLVETRYSVPPDDAIFVFTSSNQFSSSSFYVSTSSLALTSSHYYNPSGSGAWRIYIDISGSLVFNYS